MIGQKAAAITLVMVIGAALILLLMATSAQADPERSPRLFVTSTRTTPMPSPETVIMGKLLDEATNQPVPGFVLCLLADDGDRILEFSAEIPEHCLHRTRPYAMPTAAPGMHGWGSRDAYLTDIVTDGNGNFILVNLLPGGYWILNGDGGLPIDHFPLITHYFEVPARETIIVYVGSFCNYYPCEDTATSTPTPPIVQVRLYDMALNRPIVGVIFCLYIDNGDQTFDPASNTPSDCALGLPEDHPYVGDDVYITNFISNGAGEFYIYGLKAGYYWIVIGDETVPTEIRQSTDPYLLKVPVERDVIYFIDGVTLQASP